MNLLTDFEAHKRDEDFAREDEKSGHATHAQKVAFADAMMAAAPSDPDEQRHEEDVCCLCGRVIRNGRDREIGRDGIAWHRDCARDNS